MYPAEYGDLVHVLLHILRFKMEEDGEDPQGMIRWIDINMEETIGRRLSEEERQFLERMLSD